MNKKIKNRIVFYTTLLVLFVVVNIVVSFAYLRGKANNNESVSTIAIEGVGNINVVYSSNTPNIVVNDILPGYETEKKFSVTSNISSGGVVYNRGIWYQIKLIVDTNEFLSGSLVYSLSLDDTSSTDGITALPVDKIAIPNGANSDGILIGTGYFSSDNVSHIYNLKLNYVNMEEVDQSDDYQSKFAARVVIDNPDYVNLTFDLDGGSFENLNLNSSSTMKIAANSTIDLPIPNKDGYIFAGWEIVSGNVSANNTVITTNDSDISIKALWNDNIPYEFAYTGGEQEYIVPINGYYKIEVWGAEGGGYSEYTGGYGGYSTGIVYLSKNENLYTHVGQKGGYCTTTSSSTACVVQSSYNGGGGARSLTGYSTTLDMYIAGAGGGATHISTERGTLNNLEMYKGEIDESGLTYNSLKILIVAGGGGGGAAANVPYNCGAGGHGGGYIGGTGTNLCTDGTASPGGDQFSGNAFGQGGSMSREGGGGGFYGGDTSVARGSGGGSGYIGNPLLTDKYMYCYDCDTSNDEPIRTYTTTCAEETPTENCAKIGNGYARITYLHS